MQANKEISMGENTKVFLTPISMKNMIHVSARFVKPIAPLIGAFNSLKNDNEVDYDALSESVIKVMDLIDPDEMVNIAYYLMEGCSVSTDGFTGDVETREQFEKIKGITPTDFLIFVLEALRYHKFPFFSKVKMNFSDVISKIDTIAEEMTKGQK